MWKILSLAALAAAAWISPWGFPYNLPIVLLAGLFCGRLMAIEGDRQ